jgi:hypothetical protein
VRQPRIGAESFSPAQSIPWIQENVVMAAQCQHG